jgi:signal transduction histidine kinase/DNA-binding response OmpR family regulator/Tfp pilus assembly protein PilF
MQLKLTLFFSHVFLILFSNFSISQKSDIVFQKEADSLKRVLKNTSSAIVHINLSNKLSRVYVSLKDYEEAMKLALRTKSFSEKINYGKGKTAAQVCIGEIYRSQGDFKKSKTSFDEALRLAKINEDDFSEALVYDQLGHLNWSKGDTLNALDYHKKALQVRLKSGSAIDIGESYSNIAEIYSIQGKIKEAYQYFSKGLEYFKKTNRYEKIAWSAGNVGTMQYWLGNRKEAIKYYIVAYENYEILGNNEGFVWMNSSIANIYKGIFDYENAFKYAQNVLENHTKTRDTLGIGEAYLLKGGIYFSMKDYQNAKIQYEKGNEIFVKKKNSIGIMNALLQLSVLHVEMKEFNKALDNIKTALEIAKSNNQFRIIAQCQLLLGQIYIGKGETVKARGKLNDAFIFFKKSESISNLVSVHKTLATLDSIDGDYKSAFENFKEYIYYSKLDRESDNDTEKIAMRYKFEKKQALDASEIKIKNTQRNAAIFGLILTTLLIVILIYFFRLRNRKITIEKEKIDLQKRDIDLIKETEQFKSRFLTNITHEFRTPLTLIKGHLEVLKENGRDEDQFRFQEMDNNGSRLLQLISQLLDLSKMESGEYKLNYRSGNVINETVAFAQSFQSLADQKQVKFIINRDLEEFELSKSFSYSQEALAIIISNLLSNSFKFTPKDGTVTVDIIVNSAEYLTIKVSDTGKGIPAASLPKIFDRFYQVDQPDQRTYEGSGIGLALVKELAMIHGGDVTVESAHNKGCVFSVVLKSSKEGQSIEVEEEKENVSEVVFTSPATEVESKENELPLILVVEDHTELRRFIVENLGSEYNFAEAVNGQEGIQMAEELMPDLIISDVMMPDVDGLEMCQHLKSHKITSHIPIMLLTAKAEKVDKLVGLETGANDYLTKPFSLAEIKLRVKNMLNLRQEFHKKFEGLTIPKPEFSNELSKKDEEFLEVMNQTIQANLSNQLFGATELSEIMFLSISQFNRKLKSITGITAANYIRNYKLQKAVEMLTEGMQVAEAGWEIGFGDPVYFSKVFKKHFGYPPSELRK